LASLGCEGVQHEVLASEASAEYAGAPELEAKAMRARGMLAGGYVAQTSAGGANGGSSVAKVDPRKMIYTANLRILVAEPRQSVQAARDYAIGLGGYMQNLTGNSIVMRIPTEKFEQAIKHLEGMGVVIDKNITAQDVTERYVDLEIRLKNSKALLEKLRNLLDRATTVKDALQVEREIARVQSEVERLEGQLNRLKSQIAYSTISVTFEQYKQAPPEIRTRLPFRWLYTLGIERLLGLPETRHLY